MLMPEQVIPFLTHSDPIVRDHAWHYFAGANDVGPLTADHYWQAIDQLGIGKGSIGFASHLRELRQTESSYQRLMRALADHPEELDDLHLQHAVGNLDLELVRIHGEEILSSQAVLPHVRDHLRQRLELADEPVDRLWDRLMERGKVLGDRYMGEFDGREFDRLIEALARAGDRFAAQAMAVMDDPAAAKDWREVLAVRYLGAIRYQPAVDALVARFLPDADLLREEAAKALARIGTTEVIQKIEAFCPGKAWDVRLYAHDPISHIKHPRSEAALLHLLESEGAEDLRCYLLCGLCDLGSLAGLEASRRLIAADPDDAEVLGLCEALLAVAAMTGTDLPDAPAWRAAMERRDRSVARRLADFDDTFAKSSRQNWRESGISFPPKPPPSAAEMAAEHDAFDDLRPIQRTEPKVGRNDPCPCGSGKKYKKCCLGK